MSMMPPALTPQLEARMIAGQTERFDIARLNSAKGQTPERARAMAEEFEAVFLSAMLEPMFSGIDVPEPFGGGNAEDTFRGMMVEEIGKSVAASGGIGLADAGRQPGPVPPGTTGGVRPRAIA